MKTKIKRHSRSAISVILAISMLISCMMVGLIATDAAKLNGESVGYSNTTYVKGSWDNWATPDDNQGHKITSGYTVSLAANTTYEFVLVADNGDVFKKDMTIKSSVENYDFPKDATVNAKLKTTVAGNYIFKFKQYNGDNAMRIDITYPTQAVTTTWTVVGSATGSDTGGQTDVLFGSSWDPTVTANDMTKTSDTTWTWTKNNVQLSAGTIKYKVAKNHAWDTAYPSANATQEVSADGTYNVTVTYNSSDNSVSMTLTSVAKSTLTVQSDIANATVTATYNGTTAQEGGTISNVPQGAKVTISVTPDTGYQCTGITSSNGGTTSGSMYSFTLTMPGANTTVGANITTVSLKKIYFNNSYTLYGSVYAYVYDKSGSDKTYEYLGAYPGTTMTKLDNSNIWYIEVPSDVDYVEFVSGEGYTTEEMSIPWTNAYPKYTAPYGNNEHPTPGNGGTWGNYLYGGNNDKRTNEYTVSDGDTMSASNLFTGITATLYDYYTDGEITASAGTASDTSNDSGWIGSIASDEYSQGTNASGWKWDPYIKLNSALSAYADADKKSDGTTTWPDSHQPKHGVTYPLYFGNLNDKDGGSNLVSSYYNFVRNANNSIDLNPNSTAITGLSGKTLANDTIHYYSAADTKNENGAAMAMFDEDFLSGENSQNKPLATILRTSTFPVRKTTEGSTTTYEYYNDRVYYTTDSTWNGDSAYTALYWFKGSTNGWVSSNSDSNGNYFVIPSNAETVVFVRMNPNGTGLNWDSDWNQTANIAKSDCVGKTVSITGYGDHTISTDKVVKSSTTTGGHDYYEFNSTNGQDNAYITNINKTNKTANIDYYANNAAWSGGTTNNTQGFFPFDYANKGYGAKDLGFGMKLTIPFTLNGSDSANGINTDGTAQEFKFSGDDDLWVFVDGKLVLDLGGAHARTTGSINFQTKKVTASNKQAIASGVDRNGSFADGFNTNANYVHTMTIYYMERGMFESNLQFGFSFHAIPNQFWIDKKIRTKDIINAGFYASNGIEAGNEGSNKDATLTEREGRFISKFEASYQKEAFTVTHKVCDTDSGDFTAASDKKYTIDNDTNTYTTPAAGTYPIKHDLGNAFIGQFTKGQYFNLKEDVGSSNKYVYTPVFSVWDQANNNKAITATGNNTSGYTFHFNPTTTVSTAIENTNIKARFENYMVAHTLYITKELQNATDANTPFTIKVLFDFENNDKFIAYPLHCFVDGVRTKLNNDGTISIKAGQTIEIDEIPQNAKIKVAEVLTDTVTSYRYAGITLKKGGTDVTDSATPETKGVVFNMGDADMQAVVTNRKPDFRYSIKYTYPSYGESPKTQSLYGNQSYTVTGVFNDSEKSTYLKPDLDANGNPVFQSDEAKRIFINNKAPYEDNFMQTLSFANSEINGGWSDGTYSCEVATTGTADYKINAYFNLPYVVNDDLEPQESDNTGKVAYLDEKMAKGAKDLTCFDWYVTSGKKSKSDTTTAEPVFVKAPLIVYTNVNDESTKKYFQYWSVKKHGGYGSTDVEYTRCYDYEFNFALFMDCIIEPVYGNTWGQTPNNPNPPTTYDMYSRFDPELQITADKTNGIKIAFLENSRNQYNNGDDGSRDKNPAADIIYSDFLLNFNYIAGTTQLNTLNPGTKKAGLVVEAVDYMQYEKDDSGKDTTIFDYDADYSNIAHYFESETDKKAAIKTWLQGGADPGHCAKSDFDVAAVEGKPNKGLDNKNCKQYYYSLNNRSFSSANGGQLINNLQNRYKVFRAYAYIGDVDGTKLKNVTISDPVYFTIYDVGSQGLADNKTNS